jgi:hypothetical protein
MRITNQEKVKEYLEKGFKIETYISVYFGARALYYLTNYRDLEITVPQKTIDRLIEGKVIDENLCYKPNVR